MPCDATLASPRVLLASVSPASLGLVLVTCLATGLGVIIARRIRREEQSEEQQSLTEQNRL